MRVANRVANRLHQTTRTVSVALLNSCRHQGSEITEKHRTSKDPFFQV